MFLSGYQAEDAEMVTVNSPSADAEAELLYPAGVEVSEATSQVAGSTSGSDTQIADDSTDAEVLTVVPPLLPEENICGFNVTNGSLMELPADGEFSD